jgi:hypothetical protein
MHSFSAARFITPAISFLFLFLFLSSVHCYGLSLSDISDFNFSVYVLRSTSHRLSSSLPKKKKKTPETIYLF